MASSWRFTPLAAAFGRRFLSPLHQKKASLDEYIACLYKRRRNNEAPLPRFGKGASPLQSEALNLTAAISVRPEERPSSHRREPGNRSCPEPLPPPSR